MEIVYIMLAILTVLGCCLIFQTGRIYERIIKNAEIDDKIDELNAEMEFVKREVMQNDR